MTLQLGETAPDFEAETTQGKIRFHEWLGDSWAVLLEPENAKKLSECTLIWTDAYDDLFIPALLQSGSLPSNS